MSEKDIALIALSERGTSGRRIVLTEKINENISIAINSINRVRNVRSCVLNGNPSNDSILQTNSFKIFMKEIELDEINDAIEIIDSEKTMQ